eukprot:4282127-Pyramimonas_sp.AAC.1
MGTSVEALGTMLKARGPEQTDADILGGKLRECMDMLKLAEKKLNQPPEAPPEANRAAAPPQQPSPGGDGGQPSAAGGFAFTGQEDPEDLKNLLQSMGVPVPEDEEEIRAAAERAAEQFTQFAKKQK